MEPWYKFILYGNYDGFSRSTLGDDNLYLVLENGEKVEVPRCFVKKASDFIEKDKLKLKDVIARTKKLDLGAQEVWLNEILNELGSDYGTLKYKAGYEQGKVEGAMEHEKVTIPQFVADYIYFKKTYDFHVYGAMRVIEDHYDKRVQEWFYEGNIDTFARAWLDGYTVEKEPKYTVKCKTTKQYLSNDELGPHFDPNFRSNFTKSDLEKLGLGWVFDCPGIEIEEV
jgi:hypothetical protein